MFKKEIKDYGLDIFVPNLTADLSGFAAICIVSIITFFIATRWPDISKIIYTALIVRILLILFGYYFFNLPDTKADALGYEWDAWNMAKGGFFNVFENFTGPSSRFYSWLMAIPYSLFGRSVLIIQSIGLLLGLGSVLLGWLVAKKIWDDHSAIKVGWVLALFPSLILYSIIPLKEVYCSFFLLVATFGIVNWVETKSLNFAILSIGGFVAAGFFHGPLFIGGIIFSVIYFISTLQESFKLLKTFRVSLKGLLVITLIFLFFSAYLSNKIFLPYIGDFETSFDFAYWMENISGRLRGNASYPAWLVVENEIEFLYKGLFRVLYFIFSPFPWEVKSFAHLIGLFDAFLYFILFYFIFLNRKAIWKNPALRIILLIFIAYFFAYGIGVSNFGSGIRHRSKFVIEIILLAAPFLPKLIFSNKNKIKEIS
ncbi:hypothetical protein OAW58_01285 [Candidatus Pelagibacter ubique]|nr:hypothetical protein [Candidatus Pelagibacter ubique]